MNKKLYSIQQKVGSIKKDSNNPFFNSKYFDINKLISALKPILNEVGVVVLQPILIKDGQNILATYLMDSESGERLIESEVILPSNLDPQKMGSAITYYRRYALQSLLFLEAEDDDANKTVTGVQTSYAAQNTTSESVLTNCDACQSTNIKHLKGVSKKTGKPYDFWKCQEQNCNFIMNP